MPKSELPAFVDGAFPLHKKQSQIENMLCMHTNCVLSNFLLGYRYRQYHRVFKTRSLAKLLMKVSRTTLEEVVTRCMTKEEKTKLQFCFDHSIHHTVVAANILLFLERRNYIDIKIDPEHQGRKFEWNEQVVHAAIEDQKECLKRPEEDSGAWILSHFVGNHELCEYVIAYPIELARFADDVSGLAAFSPKKEAGE